MIGLAGVTDHETEIIESDPREGALKFRFAPDLLFAGMFIILKQPFI
jgi:ATP-dependent helicase YprA (DUF1998 family)